MLSPDDNQSLARSATAYSSCYTQSHNRGSLELSDLWAKEDGKITPTVSFHDHPGGIECPPGEGVPQQTTCVASLGKGVQNNGWHVLSQADDWSMWLLPPFTYPLQHLLFQSSRCQLKQASRARRPDMNREA